MAYSVRVKNANNYEIEVTADDVTELPALVDRAVKKFLVGFKTTFSNEPF